jgi:hypothetical protein
MNINMNEILKPVDNFLKSINENKNILILILILLAIYYINYNEFVLEKTMYFIDNKIFKFSIFIIISYITSSSPAIGISLAIIMLVSMQLITYNKFKKEFENKNF